jgi:hypothetical protein
MRAGDIGAGGTWPRADLTAIATSVFCVGPFDDLMHL